METYSVIVFVPDISTMPAKYFQYWCTSLFFLKPCEISIVFLISPYFIGVSQPQSSNDLTEIAQLVNSRDR